MLCQRLQHLEVVEVTAIPAANGAARQRQLRILDNPVGIEVLLNAQTITGRAGACRVVERKQTRFQFTHAVAANRAGKIGGEQQLFRFFIVHIGDNGGTAGKIQSGFKGFGQTLGQIVTHFEAIDHHLNGVFLLQFQLRWIGKIADLAVDPRADIALAGQVLQRFGVLAFTFFNDWRQQHQALAFRLREHVVDHLADGLCGQRNIMVRAARLADARVQQAQIVVNFGNGPHRRARVMGR